MWRRPLWVGIVRGRNVRGLKRPVVETSGGRNDRGGGNIWGWKRLGVETSRGSKRPGSKCPSAKRPGSYIVCTVQ